jgi:hypothetical protein
MTVTATALKRKDISGSLRLVTGSFSFDSVYPAGGETLTGLSAELERAELVFFNNTQGLELDWDAANQKVIANDKPWADTVTTVTDADGAASAGVAVYVHVDEIIEQGSALAHLEFVSPTNADGTGTTYNGGPTYYIQDDDAAGTGGVALYFDEDAAVGSRFLANTGRDCWVVIGGGRAIKVTHNASPGTPGVQVYFDEDAATSYGRLQFVSPTNASGSETSKAEVAASTDLSGITGVRFVAIGA